MDDVRVGRALRVLRLRRRLRQADVAHAAGVAQSTISRVERGDVAATTLSTLRALFMAVSASVDLDVRWRGGELDRLIDERHARLVGVTAARLELLGWRTEPEVTYAHYGERGSIDLLAHRADLDVVLVVEVKSSLTSVETTLRRIDEKHRLARIVARERLGVVVSATARLLVLPDTSTSRRRVQAQGAVLGRALPLRGAALRRWLSSPTGSIGGVWFVPVTDGASRRPRSCPRQVSAGSIRDTAGPTRQRPPERAPTPRPTATPPEIHGSDM